MFSIIVLSYIKIKLGMAYQKRRLKYLSYKLQNKGQQYVKT